MKTKIFVSLAVLCMLFTACQKEFLDKKPDQSILVPTTLKDLQSLLDNYNVMSAAPYLGFIGSDDIVTTDAGWQGAGSVAIQLSYLWKSDPYENEPISDWPKPYEQIFYANVVLTQIEKIPQTNLKEWNRIKGIALFYRALAYYNLAQTFAAPYQEQTADQEMGIPIRLSADIDKISKRGTLKETYAQILKDLITAKELLSTNEAVRTRPSKAAGFALLARVYLTMNNYEQAIIYATSCLAINSKLIDYNTLSTTATRPFTSIFTTGVNDEILYFSSLSQISFLASSTLTTVDPVLIASYQANDLRKSIFFNNTGFFKGNYSGNAAVFAGLATDEVYLIRAECLARTEKVNAAMDDLNALLISRWKKNTFVPFSATTKKEALDLILKERRKELVYRNTRWTDLKRLNLDPAYAIELKRTIYGITYTLPANDKRYVYPIPNDEIILSGLPQNQR